MWHDQVRSPLTSPAMGWLCSETMGGPRVKYSKTVDMYAFGVMCSELLTWSRAYHDVNVPSVFALRDKVVNQRLRPTIPSHIRDASPTTRLVGTCFATLGCCGVCAHPLGLASTASSQPV